MFSPRSELRIPRNRLRLKRKRRWTLTDRREQTTLSLPEEYIPEKSKGKATLAVDKRKSNSKINRCRLKNSYRFDDRARTYVYISDAPPQISSVHKSIVRYVFQPILPPIFPRQQIKSRKKKIRRANSLRWTWFTRVYNNITRCHLSILFFSFY